MTTICESCDLKDSCWDYPNEADGCELFYNNELGHLRYPVFDWIKKIFNIKGKRHDAS